MKFSWFLALRYLKPKRTFISIITVISILGVALGVGVLIVVIAVMSGFEKRIKDEWLKVEPPLFLHDENRSFFAKSVSADESVVPVWRELLPKVKSFPGVEDASPFVNVVALMQQAVPKEHDADSVSVGELPPDSPPSAPDAPPAPESPSAPNVPEAPSPPEPPGADETAPGDTKTTVPDASATADRPPADPPPDIPPDTDEPGPEEESVTGLDRTRPLTHVMIIGVDTENVKTMEKHRLRFEEQKRTSRPAPDGRPLAQGEFDLSDNRAVISEMVVEKLYVKTQEERPFLDLTDYNVFGPNFIYEGIDIVQEKSEAKDDPEKRAEVERKDRVYPLPGELRFTGVVNDDKQQVAGMQAVVYVSLKTAQNLAGADGTVDGISVELADPYDAPAMAQKINDSGILPEGWRTETWIQRHRQQFEAVANERSMMYIVLGFISLVAAFCIMNTMITMAVQKRREIGMMRALGAKTSHIVSLFMTKGFIVGLAGTGLGYVLGRLVLHFRNDLRGWINDSFGHQIFDASIYGLNEIPAELRGLDEVMICGLAFILCTLAAVPPAWMVGRMEPARALRNDR